MTTAPQPPNPSTSTSKLDIEDCKRNAANAAVRAHFPTDATFVGIGSGSTIKYVVEAIKALNLPNINSISFVPTGYQSRSLIHSNGLRDIKFDSLPTGTLIDVAFDGADEVDEDLNCIKGGGACLYQEKLVATQAKKFVCVADYRKLKPRLLAEWPSIPIEVEQLAVNRVLAKLRSLGSTEPKLREGQPEKTGPIKTDQDNFIIDASFSKLVLEEDIAKAGRERKILECDGQDGVWEVVRLALALKLLEGVLSVGIFCGMNGYQAAGSGDGTGGQKPIAAFFGMEDGTVVVRVADEQGHVTMNKDQS